MLVLVSDKEHSDSVIYIYILLQLHFYYRLLQDIEYKFLVLYSSRSLWFICFINNSVYMLIAKS